MKRVFPTCTILCILMIFSPFVIPAFLTGCTENTRAKYYGGTATIQLPKGTKLVTATWKDDQLWYLYRPAKADETAETVVFKENSKYGLVEGKVIFVEQ